MQLTTVPKIADRLPADLVVLPFWQGIKKGEPAFVLGPFKEELAAVLDADDFKGKEGETALVYTGHKKESRLLLLGCGKKAEATDETFRRAASVAVKLCRKKEWTSLTLICPEQGNYHTALVEGVVLSNYVFSDLKSEKETPLRRVCFVGVSKSQEKECFRAETVSNAVNFARDLINGNADDITPQKLAETAKEICKGSSALKATVLGKAEITKAGLGLLLAVNRASFRDPALIIVEYRGNPSSKDRTALVGKGITYDTGGLILKPKGGMETMKDDMSGGAAVLGTLKALAALKVPVNVIGVIPATENSIGSKSYKPGDVYKSYSGKTVEVYDTDAEGRLVLADAISYVIDHYKPSRVIDLATLTGGIVVALGDQASGLFSNDEKLAAHLFKAGEAVHERLWRMPLFSEYKEALKSPIADIKNASVDRKASSSTGAVFIQSFVDETPWAHLDIAGTAYLNTPRDYHSTPATGVGVRLLVEYFTQHEV